MKTPIEPFAQATGSAVGVGCSKCGSPVLLMSNWEMISRPGMTSARCANCGEYTAIPVVVAPDGRKRTLPIPVLAQMSCAYDGYELRGEFEAEFRYPPCGVKCNHQQKSVHEK